MYVHEVLVNRLGGLSLPRKSVVRLIDRPDMTLNVYRGCKTTIQQQQNCTVGVIYMQVYLHILVFNKCIQCTCNCTWLNILEIATVLFWSPLQCEKGLEQIIARTPFVMH